MKKILLLALLFPWHLTMQRPAEDRTISSVLPSDLPKEISTEDPKQEFFVRQKKELAALKRADSSKFSNLERFLQDESLDVQKAALRKLRGGRIEENEWGTVEEIFQDTYDEDLMSELFQVGQEYFEASGDEAVPEFFLRLALTGSVNCRQVVLERFHALLSEENEEQIKEKLDSLDSRHPSVRYLKNLLKELNRMRTRGALPSRSNNRITLK